MTVQDNELISVIMPAYNAEKTLGQAVESVLAQTYPHFELIVINDCSLDRTVSLAKQYALMDSRVRVLENGVNCGASRTRHKGVEAAKGKWLAFLDSDDAWARDKLEKQVAMQNERHAKLVYTGSAFMNADGVPLNWILHVPEHIGYRKLLRQNLISNSFVLVLKDCYQKFEAVGDAMHEDFACWLRLLRSGETAYGIDEPLLIYRLSASSKSGNKLRAAMMNWNSYKAIGMNALAASYYYVNRRTMPDKYSEIKEQITAIYGENRGRFGYRRITLELRNRGYAINHKTVQRLMKSLGLVCKVRMKKYQSYKGEVGKVAPNLLERSFEAEQPNRKWVTDVTEFSLFGQKLYLSPILDLCSRDLVAYTISDRPVLSLVTDMLNLAFGKLPDGTDLILHSDQGWQYQHKHYQRMLREKGIRQSMSRKGNCLDNAVIESFFGVLKSELLYLQDFDSLDHFKKELIEYLDYYNNGRLKAKLKGLAPAQHRRQALLAA